QKKDFISFLKFITKNRWSVSLNFYYMESYYKNKYTGNVLSFRKHALEYTESYLKLMLMDEDIFLKTGNYISTNNPEQKEFYSKGRGIKERSREIVDNFTNTYSELNFNLEAIEILLIKMVLINHFEFKNKSTVFKLREFNKFMQEILCIVFARECYLAYKYFNQDSGKFLGVQVNSNYDKAISNIKSTAWDIFLLRIHEFMLRKPDEDNIFDLGYLVTKEKQLFEFGKLFEYNSIAFHNDIPTAIFDFPVEISAIFQKKDYIPTSYENLSYLLTSMELALKYYLQPK
ncbi:hypothetical protein, partial [Testudinibacter sp. TR-2022]